MSGKVFIDTNVLIYAHDSRAGVKRAIAERMLAQLWETRTGVLSLQVLQEFYFNVTRKIAVPLTRHEAQSTVNNFRPWCVNLESKDLATTFRIEDEAKISFWDALILTAASKAGAVKLLSEDMNSGQSIAGILIENPFAAASRQ